MTTLKLTEKEKLAFNEISSEALSLVRDNAEGVEFVRVNLYEDALNELLEKGETENEICGVHFFTNSQSDDIDKSNQNEIGSFEQDEMDWVEGDGEWTDTERGENWLKQMEENIDEEIRNILISKREAKDA